MQSRTDPGRCRTRPPDRPAGRSREYGTVERKDGFAEKCLQRHAELSTTVVIPWRRDREHSARLLPCGGQAKGADRQRLLRRREAFKLRPDGIEKGVVAAFEVEAVECRRDEITAVAVAGGEDGDVLRLKALVLIRDRRRRELCGERELVVR